MRRAMGMFLLLLAVGGVGVVVGRSIAPPTPPPTREKVEADLGLDRIVADVDFRATRFDDAVEFLRQKTPANLVVNWHVLEKSGVEKSAPITLRVANLPLRRVLELVCDEAAGGGGNVRIEAHGHDGAIVVSTDDDNTRYTETRLYDVRDLLKAHYNFRVSLGWQRESNPSGGGGARGGNGASLFSSSGVSEPYDEAVETITKLITDNVAPDMWRDAGGTVGSIRDYDGRLMIVATPDMHDEIAALLELLRKGQVTP